MKLRDREAESFAQGHTFSKELSFAPRWFLFLVPSILYSLLHALAFSPFLLLFLLLNKYLDRYLG